MAEQSVATKQILQDMIQKFKDRFQSEPQVITYAPGRIEALGNHTDYNEGFVLSAAIDKGIYFLASPTSDSTVTIHSLDLNETVVWSNISPQSPSLSPSPEIPSWSNYIKGVLAYLIEFSKKSSGFNAIFGGNLPQGAGLSSSAALEVSSALGICKILSIDVPRHDLAKICQKSEHNYVGVKCGLLDQFSSLYGKNNQLVLCDFRSLQVENVAVGRAAFLVVNTNVHHNLVTSEYNERRESCEQATKFFSGKLAGKSVTHLRDVTSGEWEKYSQEIPNQMYAKRAAHVIGENERVLKGKEYLNGQEPLLGFGKLMFESHESSRNFFENSCPELDQVVNDAKQVKEVYGARLSGGGFGGSAILLVNVDDLEKVMKQLKEKYAGSKFEVSFVLPSDGAVVIKG